MKPEDFDVKELGRTTTKSPLSDESRCKPMFGFVTDKDRILYDTTLAKFEKYRKNGEIPISFEKAGPRETIYFQPSKTKIGIVNYEGEFRQTKYSSAGI